MKKRLAPVLHGYALVLACLLSACASTPAVPNRTQAEYNKPLDVVKKAGIDAMAVNGFEITGNDASRIEGSRPRTFGFFCTPGGETARITLEETSPSHTTAWVYSEKSTFGYLCQKEWSTPILDEMDKSLGQGK